MIKLFELSQKEVIRISLWHKEHKCKVWRGVANMSTSYVFTPTGIGTCVEIVCTCGERKDITDYENW